MTSTAKRILEEAMALPEAERLALIEALSDTLEQPPVELSPEWKREVLDRLEQLQSGAAQPVDWSDVEARVQATIARQ